MIFSPPNLKT